MIKHLAATIIVYLACTIVYAHAETTVSIGFFSTGESAFEEVIGHPLEFSIISNVYHYKNIYLQTGAHFWNKNTQFGDLNYSLDSLTVPLRILYKQTLYKPVSFYIGCGLAPHFLIENFEKTEVYHSINQLAFLGLTAPIFSQKFRFNYELEISKTNFSLVNNLSLNSVTMRFGITKNNLALAR
jgi:hypothetical protein